MEERIVQLARDVLKSGNKILVVGVTPKNLGRWYRVNDSRLVFWDSRDAKKVVPAGVRLVLVTRFTNHSNLARIRSSVSDEATFYSKFVSTGQLKTLLASVSMPTQVLPQPAENVVPTVVVSEESRFVSEPAVLNEDSFAEEEVEKMDTVALVTPVVEVRAKPQERGAITSFVRKYADRDTEKPANEICRLVALAVGLGIQVTEASIKNAFYHMRSKSTKSAKVPAPTPAPVFVPAEVPSFTHEDSVQLLEKITGDMDLVQVAIREVLAEREALRQQNISLQLQVESLQAQLNEYKSLSADPRRLLEEALKKLG